MMTTRTVKEAMELEHHEFTTKKATEYYLGFMSRRKAVNGALAAECGLSSADLRGLAEVAAFYNKTLKAATEAFKLQPSVLLEILEGGK